MNEIQNSMGIEIKTDFYKMFSEFSPRKKIVN